MNSGPIGAVITGSQDTYNENSVANEIFEKVRGDPKSLKICHQDSRKTAAGICMKITRQMDPYEE